jgi:hypothetical protein
VQILLQRMVSISHALVVLTPSQRIYSATLTAGDLRDLPARAGANSDLLLLTTIAHYDASAPGTHNSDRKVADAEQQRKMSTRVLIKGCVRFKAYVRFKGIKIISFLEKGSRRSSKSRATSAESR